jgi:hypothetical protein
MQFDSRSIALAAAAGLTLGATACKGSGSQSSSAQSSASPPASVAATTKSDKACCKGLNDCKGKGGCSVDGKHDCAGKNDCKGQGGCNMHCPQ